MFIAFKVACYRNVRRCGSGRCGVPLKVYSAISPARIRIVVSAALYVTPARRITWRPSIASAIPTHTAIGVADEKIATDSPGGTRFSAATADETRSRNACYD